MKFLNFLKIIDNKAEVHSISDKDIELLVVMCRHCEPKVFKDGFVTKCYAYYVPQDETDLETAKEIFIKHGIPVEEHLSYILGFYKQKVLRMDYSKVKNKDKLKREIRKIEKGLNSLYASGKWVEKQELQRKIQESIQNQK